MGRLSLSLTWIVIAGVILTAVSSWAEGMEDWLAYERPATYEAIVTPAHPMMRDGICLDCTMAVPGIGGQPAPGAFPGIVTNVVPYTVMRQLSESSLEYWAERGYQALSCNVRGTGDSEGYYPYNNQPAEWNDSYDMVEWLAGQPGSNGRIGQEGASYGGMTSYQAAIGNAPHLVAIAPQIAPNDLYLDDVYPGGVKKRPYVTDTWPLTLALTTYHQVPARRIWDVWLEHPTHDSFWDGIAFGPKLGNVNVPVLVFMGWDDELFKRGALRNYEALVDNGMGDTTWLVAGPWIHLPMFESDLCAIGIACVDEEDRFPMGVLLAWFDRWLLEDDHAPLPPSPVLSFEMPKDTGMGWEMFDQWPPEDAATVEFSLRRDGTLGEAPGLPGTSSFDQTPLSGVLRPIGDAVFTTPVLDHDVVLSGDITLTLKASYTAPDANIHAELFERIGDESRLINDGWLKISHRDSHVSPTPVVAGETVTATLEIRPTHRRIPAGAQIELRISGGGAVDVIPVDGSVRTDIKTGLRGSTLRLTVRGGNV